MELYKKWIFNEKKRGNSSRYLHAFDLLEGEIEDQELAEDEDDFIDDECGLFEFSKTQSKDKKSIDESIHEQLEKKMNNANSAYVGKYDVDTLKQLSTWLQDQKKCTTIPSKVNDVDLRMFDEKNTGYKGKFKPTAKQIKAFKTVEKHYQQQSAKQLLFMVLGQAGTGKSTLIKSYTKLLGKQCKLMAPTGNTAFNIGGATTCSQLWLPVAGRRRGKLTGNALKICREKWPKHIKYVIIDEMGMIGQEQFSYIDQRLREITNQHSKMFGGLNVILLGDFAQLPPVMDSVLWKTVDDRTNEKKRKGKWLYNQFTKAVTLNEVVRQKKSKSKQFVEMLARIRDGDWTKSDWKFLQKRWPQNFSQKQLRNFDENLIRIFATNKVTNNYNHEKLPKLNQPIIKSTAEHSNSAAKKAPANKARGLWHTLYLAKGAKVRLTENLWTESGLYNGATGIIKDIIYAKGSNVGMLPDVILVHFPKYRGPTLIVNEVPMPGAVPIVPFKGEFNVAGKNCWRLQVPLKLAWAMTVHASQGLTLEGAWINIGKKDIAAGMTYVALSRLVGLENSVFDEVCFERLLKCKSKNVKQRIDEEQKIKQLEEFEDLKRQTNVLEEESWCDLDDSMVLSTENQSEKTRASHDMDVD